MQVVRQVVFELKNGQTLTIDMTDVLLERIKETFMLGDTSQVNEKHVKYFLASAMKNALGGSDESRPD